jgi:hypothetical protein
MTLFEAYAETSSIVELRGKQCGLVTLCLGSHDCDHYIDGLSYNRQSGDFRPG